MNKFGIGYIIFFIFIFPMFFEYIPMIESSGNFHQLSDPWTSMIYLALGAVAWLLFIVWIFVKFIKPLGQQYNNVSAILKEGVPTIATIESKSLVKDFGAYQALKLKIRFNNLAGTSICIPYEVNDSKPELKRFEIGKTIRLRLDQKLRTPILVLEDAKVTKNKKVTFSVYLAFAGLIIFSVAYLIFSYWLQNDGNGWRFLHFWHPWVTIPLWGLFYGVIIFGLILRKFFGSSTKANSIVFKGKLAQVNVIEAVQTGTYINEQPQVKFTLEFTDEHGKQHTPTFKKIVSLLELHQVQQGNRSILYLPENPKEVIFAEDYI